MDISLERRVRAIERRLAGLRIGTDPTLSAWGLPFDHDTIPSEPREVDHAGDN